MGDLQLRKQSLHLLSPAQWGPWAILWVVVVSACWGPEGPWDQRRDSSYASSGPVFLPLAWVFRQGGVGSSLSLWSQPTGQLLSGICELVKHGAITSSPWDEGAPCWALSEVNWACD